MVNQLRLCVWRNPRGRGDDKQMLHHLSRLAHHPGQCKDDVSKAGDQQEAEISHRNWQHMRCSKVEWRRANSDVKRVGGKDRVKLRMMVIKVAEP